MFVDYIMYPHGLIYYFIKHLTQRQQENGLISMQVSFKHSIKQFGRNTETNTDDEKEMVEKTHRKRGTAFAKVYSKPCYSSQSRLLIKHNFKAKHGVLACNPSTQEWRQEDQKYKVSLGCVKPYHLKKSTKTNKQKW